MCNKFIVVAAEDGMNCAFTNGKKPDEDYKILYGIMLGGGGVG